MSLPTTSSPTHLLILGGGTAGTMIANKVHKHLPDWTVTIVDKDDIHDYQPGYLFIPFGMNTPEQIRKTKRRYINEHANLVFGEIDRVDPDEKTVALVDGRTLDYDYLVIATGTSPRPDQTPGMLGDEWHKSIAEFYTYEGAIALRDELSKWDGGRLVVHVTEMPTWRPVAPLEFTFLADDGCPSTACASRPSWCSSRRWTARSPSRWPAASSGTPWPIATSPSRPTS
ncbi:MAG: FAD-dependent oxidoreductase [Nocardioides sp.]